MEIPRMKNYPQGEYSLIQISPTIDSQELINIGVILKSFQDNVPRIRLFDDMSKLIKRVHIENINSLEYALNILKKTVDKNSGELIYQNFTNSIKIHTPTPISITEATMENQLEKLYYEKITLLKTFPADNIHTANNILDKNHIIDNLNSYIRTNNLSDMIKTRKKIMTTLGVKKQIDTIAYNQNNEPIIVSDIISPATSKIDEIYAKSLFTLSNLTADTIQQKTFYIPTMDGIDTERLEQIRHIKAHIIKEGISVNDSQDPNEFIESMANQVQTLTA